ncbi:MAG: methyltransferase domain-containing protein [Thermoanaerobaculia bacterium]
MRARFAGAVIDLGTGDGRFVSVTAAARRDQLVIGIDANAASMAKASRRAARSDKRGGLANALFVVAAAEALPAELNGVADALTVHFPWGSLLRSLLTTDATILEGIARVTRPGAPVTLLLSLTERDNVTEIGAVDEHTFAGLAPAYAAHGLTLLDARPATPEEIARLHSTWAKRLGAGTNRPAWRVSLRRSG